MEFALRIPGPAPDLAAIEREIAALDPAVLLDADGSGQAIRISTSATDEELLACLHRAGLPATTADLMRLPSVCCGGCGG